MKVWINLTIQPPTQLEKLHDSTTVDSVEHDLTSCPKRSRCEICVGATSRDGHLGRQNNDDDKSQSFSLTTSWEQCGQETPEKKKEEIMVPTDSVKSTKTEHVSRR